MKSVFLGLGSNKGDRLNCLEEAIELLPAMGFRVSKRASYYETEPVGVFDEAESTSFLNTVVQVSTVLSPEAVLDCLKTLEARFGRPMARPNHSGKVYQSRFLDIDLLFYEDLISSGPALEIPHPRIVERRFVLVPLAEIAPEFVHPVHGSSIRDLLNACEDVATVRLYEL